MSAFPYLEVLAWAFFETAFFPGPGTELFVIPFVATSSVKLEAILIALSATVGSVSGATLDYWVGRWVINKLDARFQIRSRAAKELGRYSRFGRHALVITLFVGRVAPLPLKPIMFLAGSIRFDFKLYCSVIALASFLRYFFWASMISFFVS